MVNSFFAILLNEGGQCAEKPEQARVDIRHKQATCVVSVLGQKRATQHHKMFFF